MTNIYSLIIFFITAIIISICYIRKNRTYGDPVKRSKITTEILIYGQIGFVLLIASVIIDAIL